MFQSDQEQKIASKYGFLNSIFQPEYISVNLQSQYVDQNRRNAVDQEQKDLKDLKADVLKHQQTDRREVK